MIRVDFYFFPELADKNTYILSFQLISYAPDLLQHKLMGEDFAFIFGEEDEEIKFG
jgi:hypothetical protein